MKNHRLAALVIFLYMLTWATFTVIVARGGGPVNNEQIFQLQLLALLIFTAWRTWRWHFNDGALRLSWLIYTLPLFALELLQEFGRRMMREMEPSDSVVANQLQEYVPILVLLLGHLTQERRLWTATGDRWLDTVVHKVTAFQSTCVVIQTVIITWLAIDLLAQWHWPAIIISIGFPLDHSLRLVYLGALIRRKTITPYQLLAIAAISTVGIEGWSGMTSMFEFQIFQPLATTSLTLLILLSGVILPTLMIIALGSLAAAELERVPWYIIYANSDIMFGLYPLIRTATGVNLCLVLACLLSQLYSSWHDSRTEDGERARAELADNDIEQINDDRSFVLIQP